MTDESRPTYNPLDDNRKKMEVIKALTANLYLSGTSADSWSWADKLRVVAGQMHVLQFANLETALQYITEIREDGGTAIQDDLMRLADMLEARSPEFDYSGSGFAPTDEVIQ